MDENNQETGISVDDYVNSILEESAVESTETDSTEQPEEVVETDEVDDTVEADEVDTDVPEEDEIETEEDDVEEDDIEESEESEENPENADDEDGLDIYQIGEIQATAKEVMEWKEGSLRQSDYTKKTQEVAEERKLIKAKDEEVELIKAKMLEDAAMLELYLSEVNESETLEELEEYGSAKELKEFQEKQDKRKALLSKIKQENFNNGLSEQERIIEGNKIMENNPDWTDADGKATQKREDDLKLMNTYLDSVEMPEEARRNLQTSYEWKIILDAARASAQPTIDEKKANVLKKKIAKAPVVIKGKSKKSVLSVNQKALKDAEAKFAKTGSIDDYVELERLQQSKK